MRISDWSSDVCSSDLRLAALGDLVGIAARGDGVGGVAVEPAVAVARPLREAAVRGDERCAGFQARADFGGGADAFLASEEMERQKLGRASGRERVCKYVSISVVAGSLKKKNKRS